MASTAVSMLPKAVIRMTSAGGVMDLAFWRISSPEARAFSRYKSVMTNSGVTESSAAKAALASLNGKISCPSARSISVTI